MAISPSWLEDRIEELKAAIMFSTRLPLWRATPIAGGVALRAAWAFPIAGLVVGLTGALVYALVSRAGLPPWPAAALALAATMLTTGCLHEDGLADTADGFGGGATREQKLVIMRDSRIGAYGACALALSILLRASALAALADPKLVLFALVAAHGAARAIMIVFMSFLPPARSDGLSVDAGAPSREGVIAAGALGVLILLLCLGLGLGIVALALLCAVCAAMVWLSLAQVGGQTGDVLGAVEQVSEIVVLLVALR
jgi:adenosylcobinamide-GDP ribazoletransferase